MIYHTVAGMAPVKGRADESARDSDKGSKIITDDTIGRLDTSCASLEQ